MTDQELSFDYEMATMSLKAKRYKEAEERFMNIGSKTNSWEAWFGLGISKYGLIMEGMPIEEVFYCFGKAKGIDETKISEIELGVIQTSGDIIKNLFDLIALCQRSAAQANAQMAHAALSGIIGAAMTMRDNSKGKVMGSIMWAGATAISYDGYVNARTTISELKALHDNALVLIRDIHKHTVTFVTAETEVADKFNVAVTNSYNQVTVVQPIKNEAIRNQSKARSNKHAAWFFYFIGCMLFFMGLVGPKESGDYITALVVGGILAGIGYRFDMKSKALDDSGNSETKSSSNNQQSLVAKQNQEDIICDCVEDYIKAKAYDPDSYESVGWDVNKKSNGNYQVKHYFNIRNEGEQNKSEKIIDCIVSPNGPTIIHAQLSNEAALR